MRKTYIVNYFGGPGSGKSTLSAGLFYKFKMIGLDCEIITEKAKDLTWEKNWTGLRCQPWVSGSQLYRQERLEGQVDLVMTDSPILLGLLYYKEENKDIKYHFERFIIETFKSKNNINVFVQRQKSYNPNGRNQTEEEALEIDNITKRILDENSIEYMNVDGTIEGLEYLFNKVWSIVYDKH